MTAPAAHKLAPLWSSRQTEWETPPGFFKALDAEFQFTLDAAATSKNTKCCHFISPEQDALSRSWGEPGDRVWLNPPYGRNIGKWIEKAYRESTRGVTVVALVPARTDTAWWHSFAMCAAEIRFVWGRLTFVGAKSSAPFPSVVLVFRVPFYGIMDRVRIASICKCDKPTAAWGTL